MLFATVQVEDIGPKIRAYNAPACQTCTRLRLWHAHEIRAESKFISINELGFCLPIVVILLSVLMAVYTDYSAMLSPLRTKDKNSKIALLVACLDWEGMAKICSLNIYVGCFTMLTLLRFEHFLMLCRTRGMNIGNFLSRNRIRIGYYSIVIQYYTSCRSFSCLYWHTVTSYYPLAKTRLVWNV